jgi:hypothetical protein
MLAVAGTTAEQAVIIVLGMERLGGEREEQRGGRQDEGETETAHLQGGTCAAGGR